MKATEDLKSIVTTMKMLSSVSVNQYNTAFEAIQNYGKTIYDGFLGLYLNGFFSGNAEKLSDKPKTIALLIGSDNGLVGPFNKEVLRQAITYLKKREIDVNHTDYICIGRRIGMISNYAKMPVVAAYPISNSLKEITSTASILLSKIQEIMQKKKAERVLLFYNKREEQHQIVHIVQLLPLPADKLSEMKEKKWEGHSFPLITADYSELLRTLIHEYLSYVLSSALISSLACEHYTRMINMQQAEKNIDESLNTLNLEYQQARQNAITSELIDIVSGAESIKKKKK